MTILTTFLAVKATQKMKIAIKAAKILSHPDYIAQVDWSQGDAGEVGTPGAVKYGNTASEAYQALQECLEIKGHTIIQG